MNKKFIDALVLIGEGKDSQAVPLLRELADNGDKEAKFVLAGEHLVPENGVKRDEQLCIKLLKDAADNDGYEPAAGMLSAIYYEGIGTRKNYAESAHYAKMVTEDETNDTEPWKGIVYNILGMMSQYGRGTTKNIPEAWHMFRFAIGLGNEDAIENMQKLESNYPMTSDGTIDISRKGRSAWLTVFLVLGAVISGFLAYMEYTQAPGALCFAFAAYCLVCLLMLFWVPYSVYGMVATLVAVIANQVAFLCNDLQPVFGDQESFMKVNGLMLPSLLTCLAVLKRKKGYAHPWNILTQTEYDGRGLWETITSTVMAYGKGEEYKTDSPQTKIANVVLYAMAAGLLAMVAFTAWKVVHIDFSFEIEWNCFNNGLYVPLCVVGFFLQFFSWSHLSYVTYWKWKDEYGREHMERDNDMMTEIEGGFLMPLLGHLLLIPMLYGAMLYYVLMGGFALLQSVMPWILGALTLASICPVFLSLRNLLDRKLRFFLIPGFTVVYLFIYLILIAATASFM